MFFSNFFLKELQNWYYYTSSEILYKLQLTIHRIYYFYYLLFIQLSQQVNSENLIGTLCVVSGHFVFSFYIFLCLVNMFSIILCTMSNKILPYHYNNKMYAKRTGNFINAVDKVQIPNSSKWIYQQFIEKQIIKKVDLQSHEYLVLCVFVKQW